ncbi:MAG: CPBP family intramembrane glutamic endopeptidase [Candidatus Kariarchaeaceae archaeon]|jgi:membrane protease YdiL (CAAX protease family)
MDYLGRLTLLLLIVLVIIIINNINDQTPVFPEPHDPSQKQLLTLKVILSLVIVISTFLSLTIFVINPLFIDWGMNSFMLWVTESTLIFLIIPLFYVKRIDNWVYADLGFTSSLQSKNVTIVGIIGYFFFGVARYFVLSPVDIPVYVLIVAVYSNAFLEELVFRSIILSSLMRIYPHEKALFLQTLIFVLLHIPHNVYVFLNNGDLLLLFFAFGFQFLHGWVFGLLYVRTRNIYPSIVCHYCSNWLGAIFFQMF